MQENQLMQQVNKKLSSAEQGTVLCAQTPVPAASQDRYNHPEGAPERPRLAIHPTQGSAFPTELSP